MKYLITDSVKHLNLNAVQVEKTKFPEGELYLRIKEPLKGEQVTIVSNILPDNLIEFLFLVDAAKRAEAKIKQIIIPFLSFTRQDKLYTEGEAVSGAVICSLLHSLKLPITIFDMHSERLKDCLKFELRSVLPLLASKLPKKDFIVISPDKGGAKRAEQIAKLLRAPLHVMSKKRECHKITTSFTEKLEKKPVLIVDDMISSGTTLIKAAEILKAQGITEIYAIASHGLFINNAKEKLKDVGFTKIIVSNTLPVKEEGIVEVVDTGPLLF